MDCFPEASSVIWFFRIASVLLSIAGIGVAISGFLDYRERKQREELSKMRGRSFAEGTFGVAKGPTEKEKRLKELEEQIGLRRLGTKARE